MWGIILPSRQPMTYCVCNGNCSLATSHVNRTLRRDRESGTDTSRRMLAVCSVFRNDNRTSRSIGYFWYGSITYAVLSMTWPSVHSATCNISRQPYRYCIHCKESLHYHHRCSQLWWISALSSGISIMYGWSGGGVKICIFPLKMAPLYCMCL